MIYIHVPFCHRKCTYCAFYSLPSIRKADEYVEAMLHEIELRKNEITNPIKTVYFGGGTPSILNIDQLSRIIDQLRKTFDLTKIEEFTLEANPEDLSRQYLDGIASLGIINRLSIGLQSTDNRMLALLGRRHSVEQAIEAIKGVRQRGIDNISIDLMFGLPRSSHDPIERLASSHIIDEIVPEHISAYALSVETGTALSKQVELGRVVLPNEDEVVAQYEALHRLLIQKGYYQYEVSNYAKKGYESKHNSRYWDRTPYVGFGPAAHSFDGWRRRWNVSDVDQYTNALLATDPTESSYYEQETLTCEDAFNERVMTALRTTRGLRLSEIEPNLRASFSRGIQPFVEQGWIRIAGDNTDTFTFLPTEEGLLHADGMAAALFI